MIYICYIIYRDYLVTYMLAVGDSKLAVGDDDNTSSGVAEVRHVQEARNSCVDEPVAWSGKLVPGFQGGWGFLQATSINKFHNFNFHRYIRILLIITNPMIYICYIKYWNNVVICMLAVRDDELNARDSEGTLFGCCRGRDTRGKSHRGRDTCRMAPGSHVDELRRERGHVRSW